MTESEAWIRLGFSLVPSGGAGKTFMARKPRDRRRQREMKFGGESQSKLRISISAPLQPSESRKIKSELPKQTAMPFLCTRSVNQPDKFSNISQFGVETRESTSVSFLISGYTRVQSMSFWPLSLCVQHLSAFPCLPQGWIYRRPIRDTVRERRVKKGD